MKQTTISLISRGDEVREEEKCELISSKLERPTDVCSFHTHILFIISRLNSAGAYAVPMVLRDFPLYFDS